MTKKPELLVDVDDVIVRHIEGFVEWNNQQEWALQKPITYELYTENWREWWGCDAEEEEQRKKIFFTPEIMGGFEYIESAEEAIPKLAAVRGLCAITARRESLKEVTEQTLESIAPGAFSEVICTTYFDKDGRKHKLNKADICIQRDSEGLIDDQLKTCLAVAEVGRLALLFGKHPKSQMPDNNPYTNLVKVDDWPAVLNHYGILND